MADIIAPKIVEYSTLKQSIPSKRVSSVIVPSSGPNCAGGSMFVINIPPTAYFDASRSFLAFTLQVTKSNSSTSWLCDPVRGFPFMSDGILPGGLASNQMGTVGGAAVEPDALNVFNVGLGDAGSGANTNLHNNRLIYNHVRTDAFEAAENYFVYCSKGGVRYTSHIFAQFPNVGDLGAIVPNANLVVNPLAKHWKALPPRPDRMHNGIHSLFKRIILRSQTGVPIEDIQEYNLLASIQRSCLQDAEFLNSTGNAEGYGDEHTLAYLFNRACLPSSDSLLLPTTTGNSTLTVGTIQITVSKKSGTGPVPIDDEPYGPKLGGVRFAMQPLMGILSTGQSLPLLFMGGITFEFHLDDANVVFIRGESTVSPVEIFVTRSFGDGAGPVYSNNNVLSSFTDSPTLVNYYNAGWSDVDYKTQYVSKTNSAASAHVNFTPDAARQSILLPLPAVIDSTRSFAYELKNIEYHADMVNFAPEFDDSIAQIISERGIQIDYTTFTNHHNNITFDGGSTTITIQDRATSLRGVFAVFRRSKFIYGNDARDIAVLDQFYKDGIKSWQFRVGTRTIPNAPVLCEGLAIESFERFLMCFNKLPTTHLSVGDDILPYIPTNVQLQDYSRELISADAEKMIQVKRQSYFVPLMRHRPDQIDNLGLVGPHNLPRFMDYYYALEDDKFPFSDPEIYPRHKFIIAQSFNEHKNTKSGINTAATALPIELILGIDSNVSSAVDSLYSTGRQYRYDVFVMSDRTLEIRCGGALTVVY